MNVPQPLFISSRLMAAYTIYGVGTLHLLAEGRNHQRRITYRYVIENADGTELETGADLSSGVGAPVDYVEAMGTLLSFLTAAAENSAEGERWFKRKTIAWAMHHSDELQIAALEIDIDPGNHPDDCARCAGGNRTPHLPHVR